MMWLVMDGLFLWQFVGLLSADDPLIDEVHSNLLSKLEQLSTASVTSATKPQYQDDFPETEKEGFEACF